MNILSFRKEKDITPFPTLIQTGTESFRLINAASLGAPRFTIYSESSVNAQDLGFFPYAASTNIQYKAVDNGFEFDAPNSFIIKLPMNVKEIIVDGYPVSSFRENAFPIPAGKHIVKFNNETVTSFSTNELQAKVLSFTGNLLSVSYGMKDIKITYDSKTRTLISLKQRTNLGKSRS